MKKNLSLIILAITAAFLIISCNKNDNNTTAPPPQSQPTGPFPLEIGNSWTYQVTFFDIDGTKQSTTGTVIYQITRDTTVDGEKWYYLKTESSGIYYLNRSNGVWSVLNGNKQTFLKYPTTKSDRYSTTIGNMRIASTDTSITVPKGTFSCYEYRLSQSTPCNDYYFLGGTGFIRIDFYDRAFLPDRIDTVVNYISSSYELVDYTLK